MVLFLVALGLGGSVAAMAAATNDPADLYNGGGEEPGTNPPPENPGSPTDAAPVEVISTSAVPSVAVEPSPPEPAVETKPVPRGAELSQAFEGSRGSKFGLSASRPKKRPVRISSG
jgi:hypothetical protein